MFNSSVASRGEVRPVSKASLVLRHVFALALRARRGKADMYICSIVRIYNDQAVSSGLSSC